MAGQAVGSLSNTKSAISEVRERGGISDMETSAIGGAGRRGSDGYGRNMAAPHKNIADEFMKHESGSASTGQTGPNSGFGKEF